MLEALELRSHANRLTHFALPPQPLPYDRASRIVSPFPGRAPAGVETRRMTDDVLIVEDLTHAGRLIRVLKLNRPGRRNCLNLALLDALNGAIRSAGDAVLLLAARGPDFCTGLDLAELFDRRATGEHLCRLIEVLDALAHHPSPTVSLIDGQASGGGVALACCADGVLARRCAWLKLPGNRALRPMVRVILPLIAARRNTDETCLDSLIGETLTVDRARSERLVDRIVDDGVPEAIECAASQALPDRRVGRAAAAFELARQRLETATAPEPTARLMEILEVHFGRK